jgi:hypothetical protein
MSVHKQEGKREVATKRIRKTLFKLKGLLLACGKKQIDLFVRRHVNKP